MKFTLKKAKKKIEWEGLKGWIYSDKDDYKNASFVYAEVTGSHGRVKNSLSDRVYLIVDGKGEFVVAGKTIKVGKNDVVVIPKNTIYDFRALGSVMKMYLVHIPAFDRSGEVRYEKRKEK
ncbi:cupin domain-containing protein [Patescibacteria group bacterium]|nr:cupin domain-containing protein [Patescibacteria group bacterium]